MPDAVAKLNLPRAHVYLYYDDFHAGAGTLRRASHACRGAWGGFVTLLGAFMLLATAGALLVGRATPRGETLTFVSLRDGNGEIYALDDRHPLLYNLTRYRTHEANPAWSPDGTRLAFVSWRDGDPHLYVMDIAARRTWQIAEQRIALGYRPVWSPDGARIAFEVEYNGNIDIYTVDVASGALLQVAGDRTADRYPVWSPDGTRIAFVSWRTGDAEIFVADADCVLFGNCREVANASRSREIDASPSWSPDGRSIAFWSDRSGYREVYVMNADCAAGVELAVDDSKGCVRDILRLTDDQSAFNDLVWSAPVWSPDSRQLAYLSSSDDVNLKVYRVDAQAANPPHLLADTEGQYSYLAWSPDGQELAFVSWHDGNPEIYVVDGNGRNPRRLTWNWADDFIPIWWTQPGP